MKFTPLSKWLFVIPVIIFLLYATYQLGWQFAITVGGLVFTLHALCMILNQSVHLFVEREPKDE